MSWQKIARRIRVPLGFVLTAVFLWLARPTWTSLAVGALIVAPGVWLRARAAGHVKKDQELTMTGPYAYTRNPLYLGSIIMAAGMAVASLRWEIAVILVVMFAAIYVPTIRSEENYLRATFPGFDEYARSVPRLLPRWHAEATGGGFSRELYLQHREYNALVGAAVMLAALAAKLLWLSR